MMKNTVKIRLIFIGLVFAIVVALFVKFYVYKNHRDISSEKAVFTVEAGVLYQEFIDNDSLSNVKYADKTIMVYGKISLLDLINHTVVLNEQLFLAVRGEDDMKGLEIGNEYMFKGRFVGYDDLLDELKMDQCIRIK